jgi:hypothetical protein
MTGITMSGTCGTNRLGYSAYGTSPKSSSVACAVWPRRPSPADGAPSGQASGSCPPTSGLAKEPTHRMFAPVASG